MLRNYFFAGSVWLSMASMPAHAAFYEINPDVTSISFLVSHLGLFSTSGDFNRFHGELDLDLRHPEQSRVDVLVDANSVYANRDDATNILKSAEYFDVQKFPDFRFSTVDVRAVSEQKVIIHGNLTIRNITHPLTLDADLVDRHFDDKLKAEVAVFKVVGQLRRSDYGMVADQVFVSDIVNLSIDAHIQLDPRENVP